MKLLRLDDPFLSRNFDEIQDRLTSGKWEVLSSAPSNPEVSDTYYDSTLKVVRTWNGTTWKDHW